MMRTNKVVLGSLFLVMMCVSKVECQAPANWHYQLQNYADNKLDAIAATSFDWVVIDLSRDGSADCVVETSGSGCFSQSEVAALQASGKKVLAFFELGSLENFRADFPKLNSPLFADLKLNHWKEWCNKEQCEYFVKYWDPRWFNEFIKPRLDLVLARGYDGVYLDTLLAYENIKLSRAPGETVESLGAKMVLLLAQLSSYLKTQNPNLLVVPQNSPELVWNTVYDSSSGINAAYINAIDALAMEHLYYDGKPVYNKAWNKENLANARVIQQQGKIVINVEYTTKAKKKEDACRRSREDGFVGYVTHLDLDRISAACP
jgi:cysteinyl-tRNA synthetase, unknown class